MSRKSCDPLDGQFDGTDRASDSELAKAGQNWVEQVNRAGGTENADILALLANAVNPITQKSNLDRVLQAVYATITLEEFLTLKMHFGDHLTCDQIAQRQGRPVETVKSEIARSCTRIRMYQPDARPGTAK